MSPKSSPRSGSATANASAATTPTIQERKIRDKRKLQTQPQNNNNNDGSTTNDGETTVGGTISAGNNTFPAPGGITKPQYRHSFSYMGGNGQHSARPFERRSSFASPSSSFARRRSFLSPSMISNEKHTAYELHNGYGFNAPAFSISLKESQGFSWNQDLFASQYQQQSSAIYDDDDDDDDEVEESESDEIIGDGNYPNGRQHRFGNRSLSMSNDNGYKVRVIDIKVDEDESIFQVDT